MAKILVAEDDRMLLKSIAFKLEKEGYDVVTASDGRQAVELLEQENPDLVVSDIMMPYLNGLEVIPYVKAHSENIAMIMLTSIGLEDTVVKAFELGADDFMTKPFNLGELLIRIRRQLITVGCEV